MQRGALDQGSLSDPSDAPPSEVSTAPLLALWNEQSQDHALLTLDENALIIGANPAVKRLFGYEPDELLKRPLTIIFDPEDIARGLDRHEIEVARRLGRSEDDRWQRRKDGSRFWAFGILTAVHDSSGSCIGFVKVLRDRTDLRTQLSAIENRLAVASASVVASERVVSTMAHELRTPLNTMRNALEILTREQNALPASRRALELAERQVAVMARLVDDALSAAHADRGTRSLKPLRVDVQAAIRSAIELQSSSARSRGQTIVEVLPDVTIAVMADPVPLGQILGNILDNALKYSPACARVWVTMTVEGEMVAIRVRDEGQGIAPDTLPRIFEMFTRDDRAAESGVEGFGIGLAVVKDLVQLHRGTVEVHSAGVGYGSEFTVNLPLAPPLLGRGDPPG